MKPVLFTLHPFSALAGAFLLALCLVTLGAFAPQGSSSARDIDAIEILNTTQSHDNFVRIAGAADYVVPAGYRLVITGLGGATNPEDAMILVDGVVEVQITYHSETQATHSAGWAWARPAAAFPSILQLPKPGLVVDPGQTVNVLPTFESRAWGYLIDA